VGVSPSIIVVTKILLTFRRYVETTTCTHR